MAHKGQLFDNYIVETPSIINGAILENHFLDGYQPINFQVEDIQAGASTNSTTYANVSNRTVYYTPIRTTSLVMVFIQYKVSVSLINATNTVALTQTKINGVSAGDGTRFSNSWRNTGALTYTSGMSQLPIDNTTGNQISCTVDAAVVNVNSTVSVQDIQIMWMESVQ